MKRLSSVGILTTNWRRNNNNLEGGGGDNMEKRLLIVEDTESGETDYYSAFDEEFWDMAQEVVDDLDEEDDGDDGDEEVVGMDMFDALETLRTKGGAVRFKKWVISTSHVNE